MSNKRLNVLRVLVATLNTCLGTISLVHDVISMYYIIHGYFATSVVYIVCAIMTAVILFVSATLYDEILDELSNRASCSMNPKSIRKKNPKNTSQKIA